MAVSFQSLVHREATREQLEDWCRGQARALAVTHDLVLCRVLGKYLMYTRGRDSALTPHLALSGIWEPWITMAIARHLRPGMRCLDIGACYGYYSLLMADIVGSEGTVAAWEPYHHDLVQTNADLNGLPVVVFPQAFGAKAGGYVIVSEPLSNDLRLFNAGNIQVQKDSGLLHMYQHRIPVGTTTADGADFVKIDVEGHEEEVWNGLFGANPADSPATGPVTVCLEFTPSKHRAPAEFLERIEKLDGFRIGTVGSDGSPRPCTKEEALQPDTGDFRMLWLTRS